MWFMKVESTRRKEVSKCFTFSSCFRFCNSFVVLLLIGSPCSLVLISPRCVLLYVSLVYLYPCVSFVLCQVLSINGFMLVVVSVLFCSQENVTFDCFQSL